MEIRFPIPLSRFSQIAPFYVIIFQRSDRNIYHFHRRKVSLLLNWIYAWKCMNGKKNDLPFRTLIINLKSEKNYL